MTITMTNGAANEAVNPIAETAVQAHGLTKVYGRRAVVRDLSFQAHWGRVTGFLGPNGAGKTTTLRMVLGLSSPTAGAALVAGRPYRELRRPATVAGVVLGPDVFHPARSAMNHLLMLAAAARVPTERVDAVLEMVDLTPHSRMRVGKYSLGMRQRLAIAAALLGDPRALILDEPANGLDPAGIRWLRDLLRDFAAPGRAVLISSHLLGEMSMIADDLVIIDRGSLVVSGPVQELTEGTVARVVVRTADAHRLAVLLRGKGVQAAVDGDLVTVTGAPADEVGAAAAEAGIALSELRPEHPNLEDVFFRVLGGGS